MSITNGGNIVPRDDNNDIVPIEDGPAIISGPTEIQRYDPLANHQVFLTCLNMDEERDRIAYASARSKADMDAGQMIGLIYRVKGGTTPSATHRHPDIICEMVSKCAQP